MFWITLSAVLLFGLFHSLLAALGIKSAARRRLGERRFEGFYRLLYNLLSVLTFAPIVLIVFLIPSRTMWAVPQPWAAGFLVIQIGATLALILAVLQADPLRFTGLRQVLAYYSGAPLPLPPEPLQTAGFYGLVRHPLYLFSLLALWFTPVMSEAFLGLVVASTLYFIFGSRLEEQRLSAEFGLAYTAYRQRVPWLLPGLKPRD